MLKGEIRPHGRGGEELLAADAEGSSAPTGTALI